MVNFTLEKVNKELARVQIEPSEKILYICSIETEISEQHRSYQEEISVLKIQIATMESQINRLQSASKNFKMLRFILLCAAVCLFLTPGLLSIAVVVISIVALMYLL